MGQEPTGMESAMAEDTTTAVEAWAIEHRTHNVLREDVRSLRCLTCAQVAWAESRAEADHLFASMKR